VKQMNCPPREDVAGAVERAAARFGVTVHEVSGNSRRAAAVDARHAAILEILRETGCSELGLAKVWGFTVGTIHVAKRRGRAAAVADLESWNNLGRAA
jgi:hypothetical protein